MCNENCENKNSMRLIADVDFEDDTVAVPRDEYADLIADSTILRVVEKMVESDLFSVYGIGTYLKEILSIGKPEPKPDPAPDIPSDSIPDKEDSE